MYQLTVLANFTGGGSALDDMLRLIGIAAIVFAFFAGIKSLIRSCDAAPTPQKEVLKDPVSSHPSVKETEEISAEIIAVITAAVTSITGNPQHIISIKPMSSSWERAGRQSVLTSHRIR